jgi:hypothetical protein
MPKLYLLIALLVSAQAFSQQFKISGSVADTSENKPLQNAVVSVIRHKDSVLVKFTRTKEDGSFSISNLKPSNYIVLITYPKYADFVEITKDSAKSEFDFGRIPLTQKSQLLEAVIVKQQIAAIRMKGDTLEYLTDSFAVREGAAVEELLKRLPGITVNRNGEITAQGEKVNKVLVDGEEFFSDDPAVVIKNLQADAVKNVQVFDKKSDQAEFTGIDDGQRSKTINLTLKENKKKGYFAKASVGGGTNETFNNDLMMNAFKGSRKFAAFGIMSNTGRNDLNWRENDQFGGGNNVEFDEENDWFVGREEQDYTQGLNPEEGLPKAWNAGLHFSNKWDEDRKKLNLNYRFNKNNQRAVGQTISQFILPDTQYFNTSSKQAFSSITRHSGRGIYDLKFDSLSSMKINVNGSSIQADNASRQTSASLNADSGKVNNNNRLLNSQATKNMMNASVIWRRKFKLKGRTLSINFEQQARDQHSEGFLNSATDYYDSFSNIDSSEMIDQKKNNKLNVLGLKSSVVYTEPLSKFLFVSVNYGFSHRKDESFRTTLDKTGAGEYSKRDSTLSNDFRFRYDVQSAGLDFKINKKKMMMTIGSGINYSKYRQTDLLNDTSSRYSFVNYFPKVQIRIAPGQTKSFNFRYNGSTNAPKLDQLQPVRENTDPLNIRIGNPDLRQEFTHNMSMWFNDFKVLKNRGIFFNANANIVQHAISTSTVTDEGGKTTYQSINVNGNYNMGGYFFYVWKSKKLDVNFEIGSDMNYGRNNNRVNNLNNTNNYASYGASFGVFKYKQDKYSFNVRPALNYTFGKSSLRPDVQTKYFTSSSYFEFWRKLPKKFEISSNAVLNFRQKTDVFGRDVNSIKWDAWVSRKFFKKDNLEIKASVHDILNQNLGFERNANSNIVTERSFTTLKRFFMLSIQYSINKTP